MANPIDCGDVPLPITIDLPITVTKSQIITAVNLSIPVFLTPEFPLAGTLPFGPGRIRYYDDLNAVIADWGTLGEVNKAANAFFDQNPRTQTLAIAQVFDTPQTGYLTTGAVGSTASFIAVSDGYFNITIDGVNQDVISLDFSVDVTYIDIAATIEAGLVGVGFGGATVEVITSGTSTQFKILSGTSGDGSTVSQTASVSPPTAGVDISGASNDFINGQSGETQDGYTPTGLESEMAIVYDAAQCAGRGVYGWILDNVYRDTAEQLNASSFTEGQLFGVLFTDSANPIQFDTGETVTNAYLSFIAAYQSTYFESMRNPDEYYAMAQCSLMLSVDYSAPNSIRNGKFNFYSGITPTQVSETELAAVLSKRSNVFTTIGNGARATRDGTMSSPLWFLDEKIGIDNFVNDFLTNVYNVFLSNPTVPYTPAGLVIVRAPMNQTGIKYINNGFISDRVVPDTTDPTGIRTITIPAYTIEQPGLSQVPVADRFARILNGTVITLQLSGAINVLRISVNVVS